MKVEKNNTQAGLVEIFETIIGLAQARVTNNTPEEKKPSLDEYKKQRGPYLEGKPELADPDMKLGKDDIESVSDRWSSPSGDSLLLWDGMLMVKTKDGKEVLLHPDYHPELFKVAKAKMDAGEVEGTPKGPATEEEFRAKAKEKDWIVVEENDELPPLGKLKPTRVDDTTYTYEYNGKTFAVSAHLTPFKYSVLESKVVGSDIRRTDNDINVDVADSEATDFMNAKTTEDGKTVGELFHDNMKDEWGSLDMSDPRRQYYELLQAKTALETGYVYKPAITVADGDWSETKDRDGVVMHSANTYGLLKEEEIYKKLAALSDNDSVKNGIDKLMKDAVDKIADKNGLTNKIYNSMMSDDYVNMLNDMDPTAANVRFANDFKSLQMLDKDKAEEVFSKLSVEFGSGVDIDVDMVNDVAEMVKNGSFSDESLKAAVTDTVTLGLSSTWSALFGITFTDRAVQAYLNGKGGGNLSDDVKRSLDSYKSAVKILSDAMYESFKGKGYFDMKDVSSRLSDVLKSNNPEGLSTRRGAAALINAAMSRGILPAIGGILATTAAIYNLSKNKGETVEDRMAAARLFMISIATSPAVIGNALDIFGAAFNKPGVRDLLGFGDNTQLREIFEKRFPGSAPVVTDDPASIRGLYSADDYRSVVSGSQSTVDLADITHWFDEVASDRVSFVSSTDLGSEFRPWLDDQFLGFDQIMANTDLRLDAAESRISNIDLAAIDDLDPNSRSLLNSRLDATLNEMRIDPKGLDIPSKLRLVGTVLGPVGIVADTAGGFLDLALGAMGIDKLRKNGGTSLEYAEKSMQVLGGASIAAMAGTSLAALVAGPALAAGLSLASGILGIVGVGFGVIGGIIAREVAKEKKGQELNKRAEQFNNWSELGITEDNWGDKLNYTQNARYAYYYDYGSESYFDEFPADIPVWEARPDQYEDFTEHLRHNDHLPSDSWFDSWDKANGVVIDHNSDGDESGLPRFGDDKSYRNKPGGGKAYTKGTFEDFKEDVDRVDVGAIELLDDGRVIFVKDGVKQIIDPVVGNDGSDLNPKIISYLTDLHELAHPGGKRDEKIIKRITDLHNESDRYNEIEDLRRVLSDDFVPMLGKDDTKPGTFEDFKYDIDRVDVDTIKLDPEDSSVIYFVKDGKQWKLDTDNHGNLKGGHAKEIYTYLRDLHDLIRPDGKNIDNNIAEEVTDLHGRNDAYNDIKKLREHLVEKFPKEYGKEPATFGTTYNESGSVNHNKIGTPSDFIEDIDRVDIGTIAISEDGRSVVFVKDGIKQRISDTNDTNSEIIRYLKGLHDIADPKNESFMERAKEMDRVFGATDDYNALDKIKAYMDPPKPRTWADKTPDSERGLMKVPNQDQDEFKEDMDKVDAASIRVVDDVVYFTKNGEWHSMGPGYGGDMRHIYNQLVMVANMTDNGKNLKLAARIDQIWDRGDSYNEANKLEKYLQKIGAL